MDKNTVLEIISSFRSSLEKKSIKINKIILYGSYVKGSNREGSDIDLVVISDNFKDMGYWERIDVLSEAIYSVLKPIEAVAMTTDEWEKKESFVVDYAQEGEVVFAA